MMYLLQWSFPIQDLYAAYAFSVQPEARFTLQLKHSLNSANVQQKRLRKQHWFQEFKNKNHKALYYTGDQETVA